MTSMLKFISQHCPWICRGRISFFSQHCPWLYKREICFIDNRLCPGYKEIIERDLRELEVSLKMESWKSALMLIGSMFEGLLYCFLKRRENSIGFYAGNSSFTIGSNGSLQHYLNIFRRYCGFFSLDYFPDFITSYRHIIHPNYELNPRGNIRVSEETVKQAALLLNRAIENFETFLY